MGTGPLRERIAHEFNVPNVPGLLEDVRKAIGRVWIISSIDPDFDGRLPFISITLKDGIQERPDYVSDLVNSLVEKLSETYEVRSTAWPKSPSETSCISLPELSQRVRQLEGERESRGWVVWAGRPCPPAR